MGGVLKDGVVVPVEKVGFDGLESCSEGGEVKCFLAGLLDYVQDN